MSAATPLVAVERFDAVTVVRMCSGENRFRPDSVAAIDAALDEVQRAEPPAGLVLTGEGKFFSNGLDLDWLVSAPEGSWERLLGGVHGLLARVLAFPAVTVAAINGHAYAGGAMLAMACDFRVMRADRGYLCLPEIDLGMAFTDGMAALLATKLPQPALHRMAVLGERLGGHTALTLGAVEHVVDGEAAVLDVALERARQLAAKASPTLVALRRNFYGPVIDALTG